VTTGRFINADTVMMDMVLRIATLPSRGGDAEVSSRLVTTGGGFNIMAAAARQGVDVVYAGVLGDGPFADVARSDLEREGVALPLRSDDGDLGLCVVLLESSGERTFVTSPGAEQRVRASQLNSLGLRPGDVLYFSGYNFVYPALATEMVAWWESLPSDVVVAFDPGPRVRDLSIDLLARLLPRVNWLLANDEESRTLSTAASREERISELAQRVRNGVVLHCGASGCLVATTDSSVVEVPAIATTVVDTNGAGDTHNGVFLAGLLMGYDIEAAAQRANFAASRAVSQLGPAHAPAQATVDAWYTAFRDA
jgi:sugar/nucleoside kinase (ribokinase family)